MHWPIQWTGWTTALASTGAEGEGLLATRFSPPPFMAPPSRAVHGEAGEGHPIVRIPDRGPQGRGTCAALSGKRDPRNDAHRREARRDPPRPRPPRLRPAAGHRRRRAGSAEGPEPPVRDYLGREAAARRDCREGERSEERRV